MVQQNSIDPGAARRVAQALMETPKLSIDKLPVLHSVFERVGIACTEGMRHFCAAPTTFFVNSVQTAGAWDVLEANEDSVAVIYGAPEWDARFMIGVDRRFLFSLIEAIYGSDGTEPNYESDRVFSALEIRLAKEVCQIAVESLRGSFATVGPMSPRIERVESKLEFTVLGQRDFPCVVTQILFQVMDKGGKLFILIPQSALYPMRQRLEREAPVMEAIADPKWSQMMEDGISRTDVELHATLPGPSLTLGAINDLKIGQIIELQHTSQSLVALESGPERLFWCRLGQGGGRFSLVVEKSIDGKDDFIAELIGAQT